VDVIFLDVDRIVRKIRREEKKEKRRRQERFYEKSENSMISI
jgi:hypothetical protein